MSIREGLLAWSPTGPPCCSKRGGAVCKFADDHYLGVMMRDPALNQSR